jgi:di/tricarboxylate transporter
LTFAGFIWLFGNFISHTVAALIVLPVIANVGCKLGSGNCEAGHFRLLIIGAVLMDSGAMGLPVTSFPNAQAFSLQDPEGKRYLSPLDFIKTGFILGIIELILLMTIGFELLHLVF